MARKIVQIAVTPESENCWEKVFALAADGSLWAGSIPNGPWSELIWDRVPGLPQETDEERPLYCFGGRIIGGDDETDEERPA